jgi:pimeloyl-ACP methyl ester carboxylesterase
MPAFKAVFVLVHGGWHNHSAWDRVTSILKANGFAALTLDLPGAGVNAIAPTSLRCSPFDAAAFAAERSPMAGVTQEQRTQAVVALVKQAASLSDGKVILVGHSAGGMTISAVAEQVPELLLAVVYLAGFMVPNGISLLGMLQHKTMSSAQSLGLFVGDPVAIGATRINPGSTDEAYRSLLTPTLCKRHRNYIATNRMRAPWRPRKLRRKGLAECLAIIFARHWIARFR